jgi:hypothetical protein
MTDEPNLAHEIENRGNLPAQESIEPTQRRFGRLYASDPADLNYPLEARTRSMRGAAARRQSQAWRKGPTLDQKQTSRCTQYGTCGALGAAPYMHAHDPLALGQVPLDGYADQYAWSQAHDEFEGDESSGVYGSSGRAAMDYLRKRGVISAYYWARNVIEADEYISRAGGSPLVAGSDWIASMDKPNATGVISDLSGDVVGGHEYVVLWHAKKQKLWKCQNSWGENWGVNGVFYLPDELFEYLIWQANGDLASMVEVRA